MRREFMAGVALVACLAGAAPARAGVYNSLETELWPHADSGQNRPDQFTSFERFLMLLGQLRGLPVDRPQDGRISRPVFLERVRELEDKGRRGTLTVDDRIDLGACYIRLSTPDAPRYEAAIRVLEAAASGKSPNFLALSNLATAYHLSGQPERAIHYLRQSLAAWPRGRGMEGMYAGMTRLQLIWFYRVERYYLTLLEARQRETLEAAREPGRRPETIDALFPGFRLGGPAERYIAGEAPLEQMTELPSDARAIVIQLVLWLPFDNRLYWLLGELLNAAGLYVPAYTVLDDLSYGRSYTASSQLLEHRKVLYQAREEARRLTPELTFLRQLQLLQALAPRAALAPPGAGALAQEAGFNLLPAYETKRLQDELTRKAATPQAGADSSPPAAPPAKGDWLPDWRQISVSFVAGMVVATLLSMQFREYRRRRQANGVEAAAKS